MISRNALSFDIDSLIRDPANDSPLPWQHVIDSLSEQIAIVDEYWTILASNHAWKRTSARYGPTAFATGENYYADVAWTAAGGMVVAREVLKGLDEFAAGKRSIFRGVYRHDGGPDAGRDFELCVTRIDADGRKLASIIRYDITRLVEFRKLKKTFSSSILASQAEERRRVGRDIHDSTMQLTAAMQSQISQLRRVWTGADNLLLDELSQLVAETQQAIRTISHLTHPPTLAGMPLCDAVRSLVDGFGRRTELEVAFEVSGTAGSLPKTGDEAAYRVVQEGLANVNRHAQASRVRVVLEWRRSCLHVVVADDGVGIPELCDTGVGLAGMRSRLSELGGRLTVRALDQGTAVVGSIPLG